MSCKFYQQADGFFPDSLSLFCFVEIYIQRCEEISIYNTTHGRRKWLRKIDDSFAITHHDKNNIFLELNKIAGNIKFTVERRILIK